MYLNPSDDSALNNALASTEAKGNAIVQEAQNLSWWERNFTNRHTELTQELRRNWQIFERFQNRRLHEIEALNRKEFNNQIK